MPIETAMQARRVPCAVCAIELPLPDLLDLSGYPCCRVCLERTAGEIGARPADSRRLTKARDGKMIAGVCAGLARYSKIDETWIRLWAIAATVFSGGIGIPVYVVLAFVLPAEA
jgi:phage shock protein C